MYPPSEKQFPTAGEDSSNVHGAVFNLPEAGVIDLTPFSQENVEKHVVNTVVLRKSDSGTGRYCTEDARERHL